MGRENDRCAVGGCTRGPKKEGYLFCVAHYALYLASGEHQRALYWLSDDDGCGQVSTAAMDFIRRCEAEERNGAVESAK